MAFRIVFAVVGVILVSVLSDATAQTQKEQYLAYVRDTAEEQWAAYPERLEKWRQDVNSYVLWGYNPPGEPIYLADILSFLYEETGDIEYARRTARLLTDFGQLRTAYPQEAIAERIEYAHGLPAIANFFFLPPYSRSYMRIRDSGVLSGSDREQVESDLAFSLDFVFHFPEWGAHNRAMLRAEALYFGYVALPGHPHAPRWKQMAENIASDNLGAWQIEDATIYHPVWLTAIFSYAGISGQEHILDSPFMRYYGEYFKRLFSPADVIPDFGDADWNPSPEFYIAALEMLAARYRDPELKWVAERMWSRWERDSPQKSAWSAANFARAYRWTDDTLQPRRPTSRSQEVLDDIVGKKIVFRNGWDPESTFLLLNYRDEGDGGFRDREFLRNTISVEEEKMHHGNADENDISMLMVGGSLLLHDGGYRDGLPSGEFGAFRSDYFHNRMVVRKDKRDTRYQSVAEFVRNAGAYRPVQTRKIEFLTLDEVDMSRTRLIDTNLGYTWDRVIAYVKQHDYFLVVDAVRADITDYFTYTNFWHTQTVHESGPNYYVTSIDSVRSVAMPEGKRLLIQFLNNDAREDGYYVQKRHYQQEQAIFQSKSSHYRQGDYEIFVTALIPVDAGESIPPHLGRFRMLRDSAYPDAVGIEITHGDEVSILGIKIDLESGLVRENIRPRYTWEAGRTHFGPIETDAHFLFATIGNGHIRYAASEVLKVIHGQQVLMEALPNTHPLQLDGGPNRVGHVKWRFWQDRVPLTPRR
jgi:hypothetical protein